MEQRDWQGPAWANFTAASNANNWDVDDNGGAKTGTNATSTDQHVITLPKGGGALRGIDEKFTANPATGTGSIAVPIATTPGRSGFSPNLSLSYDSGSGNGPFGLGWSLSLPAIRRRTDKGLPRYHGDDDIFVLSGTDDLVPMLASGSARKLEESVRDGYTIRRYRPRIEGLFARIERWTNNTDASDIHWRSTTPENITTLYGHDANSRVVDPADPSRIFQWLINASYDARGNAMIYEYKAEDSANVPETDTNELNRTNVNRSANRYIKCIHYGNRTPSSPLTPCENTRDWMFKVLFDYGEHDLDNPKPDEDSSWPCRRDPFSTYRAAFEVRTYRLCRRVLTFHHFPDELGEQATLVRSTNFTYEESPNISFLTTVIQSGHVRRQREAAYLTKSLPPMGFEYSSAPGSEQLAKLPVRKVDQRSLENLPDAFGDTTSRWVDLDGEGIPSVLTEIPECWLYKRNTSASNRCPDEASIDCKRTDARFEASKMLSNKPVTSSLASGRSLFMDLEGDGSVDLVQLEGPAPGFYRRVNNPTGDDDHVCNGDDMVAWAPFRPFEAWANIDLKDSSMRMIDVTGDGRADLLQAQDNVFTWYPSLGRHGFGPANLAFADGVHAPRVAFADIEQCIYLADMSGDGLADLVRVRNGSVCYWPNLGYGHFGAQIEMDNAPRFDGPDAFDQRRVRLADIDGSGTTDLLYLTSDGVKIYRNWAGNRWADVQQLSLFPYFANGFTTVDVVDLLGIGTSCLVWYSQLPGDEQRRMLYLDFMDGHKPHLLSKIVNNLGAETRIYYAPSTYFSLRDLEAGRPWRTQLPFPVHCVERIVSYDHISKSRFVSRFAYHHGYYDAHEHEFRGFAAVEKWDAEEFSSSLEGKNDGLADVSNESKISFAPPVHTKMWFHIGISTGKKLSRWLASEYFGAPNEDDPSFNVFLNSILADSDLPFPDLSLTGPGFREACRALKGSLLRQETYADDAGSNSDLATRARALIPYSILKRSYSVESVQLRGVNQHAVFFPRLRENLTHDLERNQNDPRVSHDLVLQTDRFGNVLRRCTVNYGRSKGQSSLKHSEATMQERLHLVYTETDYTNGIDTTDDYRLPCACEIRSYEVNGLDPAKNRFDICEFTKNDFAPIRTLQEIPFEERENTWLPHKRLIKRSRTLYRSDDMSRLLALGKLEARALPGESYLLAFTPGLIEAVFKRKRPGGTVSELIPHPASLLGGPEAGYVDLDHDGHWWVPGGRVFFHPDPGATPAKELALAISSFFLVRRNVDPFGHGGIVNYDDHRLLVVSTVDAMENRVECINDYRVLQPSFVTDANGNQGEVAFDALGFVVGSAVMGKPGEHVGDSMSNFRPDLTQKEIDDFFADPRRPIAKNLLGNATLRVIYDIGRFWRETDPQKKGPSFTATIARETHSSDLISDADLKLQVSITYSDGYEREIQTKAQVEPGPLEDGGPVVSPRWVCSGWTIFNNKGLPVRQYEPFFDDTHKFKFDASVGVSPIIFYDPMERTVGTINPDHSWSKVVFDPWQMFTYDVNDTTTVDPKADPDLGPYFRRLPDSDFLPTWYQARITGEKGLDEKAAAVKAAKHSNTPTKAYMDSIGRTFLVVREDGDETKFESRVVYDIQDNLLEVIDAEHRAIARYEYDMLNGCLHQASMEGGERWTLNNVTGNRIFSWNSRGIRFHISYDKLQRPVETLIQEDGASTELVMQRTIYGETQTTPDPRILNQRLRAVQIFDQAGILTNNGYDFKGNLLHCQRQLAKEYKASLDWTAGTLPMDEQPYTVSQTFDALNRIVKLVSPDNTTMVPTYNESALLNTVSANLKGESDSDGRLIWTPVVKNIVYNAKGQREAIICGNGTHSKYTYDSETFRLMRLETLKNGSSSQLQDLGYTYDPIGNITNIRDNAQQTLFFRGKRVCPSNEYTYDALYRLIEAKGREHLGQINNQRRLPMPPTAFDMVHTRLDQPGNGNAMGTYVETYSYDSVGNIMAVKHVGSDPISKGWTRSYDYNERSQLGPSTNRVYNNRLTGTTVGGITEHYKYQGDAGLHGLMTSMPQLAALRWNAFDQLQSSTRGKVGDGDEGGESVPETTYYVYDAAGQRVRKVTERQASAGSTVSRLKEHIYLGIFEIHRKFAGDGETISLERETYHIKDDQRRIALVETRTHGTDRSPQRVIRYQYSNSIGSACLELDDTARIISYEEYYPYGSTSYQATSNLTQVPKRYRYIGKERDSENGLDYHGSRYYASWIGRWISADPGGLVDGPNLYWYARCNPIILKDSSGFQTQSDVTILARGNFTGKESQNNVRLAFGNLPDPIYYTGDATWNEAAKAWIVDRSQLITSGQAGAMDNYWGDANSPSNAPTSATPPSSSQGSGSAPSGEKKPGIGESFAYGLAKGFVTGLATGLILGAVIASGGTAALIAGGIAATMGVYGGVQLLEAAVGRDLSGNKLSANERAEIVGETVGGVIGGGLGAKAGAFGFLSARSPAPAVDIAPVRSAPAPSPVDVAPPEPVAPNYPPKVMIDPSIESYTTEPAPQPPSPGRGPPTIPRRNPGEHNFRYGTRVHYELPRIIQETNPGAKGEFSVRQGLTGPDFSPDLGKRGMNARFGEMKSIREGSKSILEQAEFNWGYEPVTGRYFFYDERTTWVFEGIYQD